MLKPITPSEVQERKQAQLPDAVIEAFNALIVQHWDGRQATVLQKDAAAFIARALEITTAEVFDRGYLDVEDTYRKSGWTVDYDMPGYNETYDAFFVFRRKGSR